MSTDPEEMELYLDVAPAEFTLPDSETIKDTINMACNHEAKLVLIIELARHPEQDFTSEELTLLLNGSQGDQPGWIQSKNRAKSYCDLSLQPAGLVDLHAKQGSSGQTVTAYAISEYGATYGLAMAVAEAEWSLQRQISPQDVFSITSSSGKSRAPYNRYEILQVLLEATSSALSQKQIINRLGNEYKGVVNGFCQELAGADHPVFHYLPSEEIPFVFEINEKVMDPSGRGAQPPNRAIRQACRQLYETGKQTPTAADIIELAHTLEPGVDPQIIRKRLRGHSDLSFLALLPGDDDITDRRGGRLSVREEAREAMEDLVNRLSAFEHPKSPAALAETVSHYHDVGQALFADPSKGPVNRAKLMNQARLRSAGRRREECGRPIGDVTLTLVKNTGRPLSARALRQQVSRRVGGAGLASVQAALRLNGHGIPLEVKPQGKTPDGLGSKIFVYSWKEESPDTENEAEST